MIHITKKHLLKIRRNKWSKKGDHGRVLIVGGSKDYVGAVALAGLACLRSGADWVTVAAPSQVSWAINCLTPDIVTIKLPGDFLNINHASQILKLIEKHDVMLIGNGAGIKQSTKKLVLKLLHSVRLPFVIDADALKMLESKDVKNCIITPHTQEAEIFFHEKFSRPPTREQLRLMQRKINPSTVALLKGATDYIIIKNQIYNNTTGNPGMTRAGTGDVLAGLCAGYLAQSKNLLASAITAAFINGKVGDILLRQKKGEYSFIASDIIADYKRIFHP